MSLAGLFSIVLENAKLFVNLLSFSGHMPTQYLSNFRSFFHSLFTLFSIEYF
jgi:hypothetical protein